MSAGGDKAAVFRTTKVRNKLKGDFSWLQRREEPQPETAEEKPWIAEVKASRQNGALTETSPVSSPTKTAPSPTKTEPERASAPGFIIRGVFTKLDKPASTPTTNSASGGTQFAKKPSDSYKKIAPHTVRSTSENQEGQLSKEEQEKRTEAASNILRKSAARQRSYVLSAAKKFESQQEESETPEVKSPPFVAKRVEITDDDESAKTAAPASTPPTSPVSPVTSVAPQPKPRKIVVTEIKTAGDVAVNEPVAPKQEGEVEKKEEAAPEPVKQDSPAASATEADPFEQMTPGCTKVFTPLPELDPETVQAVCAEVEPEDSESPKQLIPPLLKVTPATPVSVSPTPESEVPDSPAPDSSVPESTAQESVTPGSQAPAPSVPESPAEESVTPESQAPAPSVPESPAEESVTPESQAPAPSVPESPAPDPGTPESPASSFPQSSALESITPESQAPDSSAPESPALVSITPESPTPASPVSESSTLVTITSESQVPDSAAPTSPTPESAVLISVTPQSPAAVESPAPDLLIPESSAPVPRSVESTTSVVLESPAPVSPAPDSPVLESPAVVSQAPEPPAVPVTDLLLPESVTTVSSDPESLVPVPPAPLSAVTEVIVNTEPEPEPSSDISSSADTLTALSDTLISFDTSSTSLKSDEPVLTGEEGSSTDVRTTDHLAELEPVPQLSNCVPVTDDLLALSNGPEVSAEPVPPSPGRWSQDLLSNTNGESNQVKVGGALDLLADDVIVINTEARSLSMQREKEIPAAEETQRERRTADPWSAHVTTTVTESSSADPFDPHPIGTTSPNRPSDLLHPLADVSINSYSTQNEDPSPETNMSSDALGSLADDIIPIDTGTASLSTQRSWTHTWDTSTPQQANADKSQGAEGEGQDGDPKMVIMFEKKSKENDSPWDRWTSPTIYTVTTDEEEEEKEESPEDTQQTQTVTTITTVREIQSEPVPAMDRYTTYSRTVTEEDQRVPTPEPEAKKGFVYVKEYVNATELALHNARDTIPSGSDLTSSLTTYSYSSPSTYSSGPLSSVCTYCGELVGNDARISIEHLSINSHPGCFKCDECSKPMGDLLDSMFIHRGKVNCETCYDKAFD